MWLMLLKSSAAAYKQDSITLSILQSELQSLAVQAHLPLQSSMTHHIVTYEPWLPCSCRTICTAFLNVSSHVHSKQHCLHAGASAIRRQLCQHTELQQHRYCVRLQQEVVQEAVESTPAGRPSSFFQPPRAPPGTSKFKRFAGCQHAGDCTC